MCVNIAIIPLKTDFLLAEDDDMSSDSESESDEEDDDR